MQLATVFWFYWLFSVSQHFCIFQECSTLSVLLLYTAFLTLHNTGKAIIMQYPGIQCSCSTAQKWVKRLGFYVDDLTDNVVDNLFSTGLSNQVFWCKACFNKVFYKSQQWYDNPLIVTKKNVLSGTMIYRDLTCHFFKIILCHSLSITL